MVVLDRGLVVEVSSTLKKLLDFFGFGEFGVGK